MENYGITGYYSQDLDKLKSDNDIFTKILKQKLPRLYNHLVNLEIDTILFTTEVNISIYIYIYIILILLNNITYDIKGTTKTLIINIT